MGLVFSPQGIILQNNLMGYSASFLLTALAANATDIVSLVGSATKNVRVLRVEIMGLATAAAVVDLQLIKRTTADTGGTPVPIVSPRYDTTDIAATAAANSWTANPAALGTAQGTVRAGKLGLSASPAVGLPLLWDFSRDGVAPVLRGVAEGLHISWGGVAVPAGTLLTGSIEWEEFG